MQTSQSLIYHFCMCICSQVFVTAQRCLLTRWKLWLRWWRTNVLLLVSVFHYICIKSSRCRNRSNKLSCPQMYLLEEQKLGWRSTPRIILWVFRIQLVSNFKLNEMLKTLCAILEPHAGCFPLFRTLFTPPLKWEKNYKKLLLYDLHFKWIRAHFFSTKKISKMMKLNIIKKTLKSMFRIFFKSYIQ